MLNCTAQEPYRFNFRQETLWLGTGLLLCGVGLTLYLQMPAPDPLDLDRTDVFRLDRFAIDRQSQRALIFSDYAAAWCILLPGILALASDENQLMEDLVMGTEAFLITEGLILLTKGGFRRPRPYAYRLSEEGKTEFGRDAARSFISGHTAVAFQSAVLAATLFQKRHPGSSWIKPVWALGLGAAAVTGFCRIESGMHFPTDVLAGAVVGTLTGFIIPRMHESHPSYTFYKGDGWIQFGMQWSF